MGLKTKVKSYSFWVSLASAVILILKLVGQKFGFAVDEGLISDLFTSLCAILVLMGIIVVPSPSNLEQKNNTEIVNDILKDKISDTNNNLDSENLATIEPDNKNYEIKEEKIQCDINLQIPDSNEKYSTCDMVVSSENENNLYDSDTLKNEQTETLSQNVNIDRNQVIEIDEPTMDSTIVATANSCDMQKRLEEFIDKVCLKRNELSKNTLSFVEFLQNEINQINDENK